MCNNRYFMARILFGKTLLSLSIATLISACSQQNSSPAQTDTAAQNNIATIGLSNPSDHARTDTVLLPYADLGIAPAQATALVAQTGGNVIPSQLIWLQQLLKASPSAITRRCLLRNNCPNVPRPKFHAKPAASGKAKNISVALLKM